MPKPIMVKPSKIGKGSVKILFFGESPGDIEVEQDEAFVGPAGQRMRTLIEAELPGKTILLDNICPQYLGKDTQGKAKKPNAYWYNKFVEYRENRIKEVKPRVIVLLGKDAFYAFKIKGHRPVAGCGIITSIRVAEKTYQTVLSIHPSYTLRSPGQVHLFKKVFERIRKCLPVQRKRGIIRVDTMEGLGWVLKATRRKLVGFDLEFSALDPREGEVLCAAISDGTHHWWIPLLHPETWDNLHQRMLDRIRVWWSQGPRVVHNLKAEVGWMRYLGAKDPPVVYDTMIQAFLLDENKPVSLNYQVTEILRERPYWLELPPKGEVSYAEVPLDTLGPYNAEDARATFRLNQKQRKEMTPELRRIADEITTPTGLNLLKMESAGIHIDTRELIKLKRRVRQEATRKMNKVEKTLKINIRSSKQLRNLLFNKWGLDPVNWTPKKIAKTDADTIEILARKEPRLQGLVEAKQADRLCTYVLAPWLDMVGEDNCIHTSFNQTIARTGRLSSSNPNMQNLTRSNPDNPRKGRERRVITSRWGKKGRIVQLDFEQHELRINAAEAGEEGMLKLWYQGMRTGKKVDLHQDTCTKLKARGVTSMTRSVAKNCNFAIIYDVTAMTLEQAYGVPRALAAVIIREWFELYPKIKENHERITHFLEKHGYVESVFGWRRRNPRRKQALNHPTQNAAVVICYLALNAVQQWLETKKMKAVLIHQIHDSLVLDVPAKEVKTIEAKVPGIMTGVDYKRFTKKRLKHDIPLAVDVKIAECLI